MTINKSLLTAAVLGVVTAAVSSVAFADNSMTSTYCKPGFYAGVQGGRTGTHYNTFDALGPVVNNGTGIFTQASTNYTTAGVIVPPTTYTTTGTSTRINGTDMDNIGIGGRIYGGYQFNPYFALETGYTQYAKTTFSARGDTSSVSRISTVSPDGVGAAATLVSNANSAATLYNGEITEHAIDLVGKGTLPLAYGFGLYAKAGVAFISAEKDINSRNVPTASNQTTVNSTGGVATNAIQTFNGVNVVNTAYSQSFQAFRPVAGLGMNYTVPNTNISIDASYTRVFSSGAIPNADLLALGAEYKFA